MMCGTSELLIQCWLILIVCGNLLRSCSPKQADSRAFLNVYHGEQSRTSGPQSFPRNPCSSICERGHCSREPIKPAISLIISELINMPRDGPDGPSLWRQWAGEPVPDGAGSTCRRGPSSIPRSLIKDSHAYHEIPKDQERRDSFEVRGLIRLVAGSGIRQDTGLPYSPRRWSNAEPILWILFRAALDGV